MTETAHDRVSDLLGPEVDLSTRQTILAIVGELEAALVNTRANNTSEDEGMQTFIVEVWRTVGVSVTVRGLTPADAIAVVKQQDFPLPEVGAGEVLDSWEFVVRDEAGCCELYRED